MKKEKSVLELIDSPFRQAGIIFSATVVLMAGSRLMPKLEQSTGDDLTAWVVLCSMVLFFTMINSVMGFMAKNTGKYWVFSILCYILFLSLGGLLAYLFSGVSFYDAESVPWLYFVITMAYLIVLSIVNLMKFIMFMVKKVDSTND